MPGSKMQVVWDLGQMLRGEQHYALLLLNCAVTAETSQHFRKLWCNASVRACVDGGANGYHWLLRGCTTTTTLPEGQLHKLHSSSLSSEDAATINNTNINISTNGYHDLNTFSASKITTNNSTDLVNDDFRALQATDSSSVQEKDPTFNDKKTVPNNELPESTVREPKLFCKYEYVPLPSFISGDFDSVEPGILEHYRKLGVQILPTPDQDMTDFTKALMKLNERLTKQNEQVQCVLVAAGISHQRFDHVMAIINTLHKARGIFPSTPVILVTPGSIMFMLDAGEHRVCFPGHADPQDNWCGYIPCTGPTTVTTKGLKWNVESRVCQFGGMVSTCNQFLPHQDALINTDKQLLFITNSPHIDSKELTS